MEQTQTAYSGTPQPVPAKAGFWKTLLETCRLSLIPTAVMALLWLLLSWAKTAGIQWAVLWPMQFLTGALADMEGSALGGTIGKAILLICFNSLFRGLLLHHKWDGHRRDNLRREFKDQTKAQLLGRIPQYGNLKLLWKDRSPGMLAAGLWGVAAALALYPFLSGNGSTVNSMVCVALFLTIGGQLVRQRGLLIALLNLFLAKKALRTVNRGFIERILAGFALGMAMAVPVSLTRQMAGGLVWLLLARGLPVVLMAVGVLLLIRARQKKKRGKEVAAK